MFGRAIEELYAPEKATGELHGLRPGKLESTFGRELAWYSGGTRIQKDGTCQGFVV